MKKYIIKHKVISVIILIVVILLVYATYNHYSSNSTVTKYVLVTANRGTLISSVSGSGQVAAVDQTTILSTVSGNINKINVSPGDFVRTGDVIAQIEPKDSIAALNNAQLSLENAQLSYEKSVKLANDQNASSSISDLTKAYQSGYNSIANTSIDLPAIFAGMNSVLYDPTHSPYFSDNQILAYVDATAVSYKTQAGQIFDEAKREYDANYSSFKNISINSSYSDIENILNTTNSILTKLLASLTGTYNTIDYIHDKYAGTIPAAMNTDKATLSTYINEVNSDTSNITNSLTSINNAADSESTADLAMKSAKLAENQAEDALTNAQTDLDNHTIRAPFDGLIAKVIANENDTASNGTQIAIIETKTQQVNISLNEIDEAKVSKGDKVTLTFDAIDGLSLVGHVTNVDLVGTVSQGVVTYNVEIAFDTNDDRVKSGMTVNADIITEAKQNVLMIPSSAVKSQSGSSYVQVLGQKYDANLAGAGVESATLPTDQVVTTGISNDTYVEILSGLNEGDQVVSKTITGASAQKATPSILSSLTGGNRNRAGGAAVIGH